MLRSPLKWVGGKSRLAQEIVKRFPAHTNYVEVFCGAAWVLFAKKMEESRCEVLNDLDGELINFWRVVKHCRVEFAELASRLLCSRELFEEWRSFPGHGEEVERAVRFYAVMRIAFGARRTKNHFGITRDRRPPIPWPSLQEEIGKISARLQPVSIERLPWQKCLALYDAPDTLFYLDPPYLGSTSKSYCHNLSDGAHEELAAALRQLKAKWLLSYGADVRIAELYAWPGVTIEKVRVRYRIQGGSGRKQREFLIRNF